MIDIRLSELFAPHFYQLHKDIKQDVYSEIWLKGGRGSTKSTFASIQVLLGLFSDDDANAVIMRRYENELRDTVYGQFVWSSSKLGMGKYLHFKLRPMEIIKRDTGQRVVFRAADNPMKLKSINLGHGYIKYAWFEEVDQFSGMEEIRSILQSIFRGEDKQRIAIYSFNPPRAARSWVNKETKIAHKNRAVNHSTYLDVPAEWLGRRFIEDAKMLQQVDEIAYRHEYLGEEVGTGLEVFNDFVIEDFDYTEDDLENVCAGMDFGFGHASAIERLGYKDGELYSFDELHGRGWTAAEFIRRAEQHFGEDLYRMEITADSASPEHIEEWCQRGYNVTPAKKGDGSLRFGIDYLARTKWHIHKTKCPMLANEVMSFVRRQDKDGNVLDKFNEINDDGIAAARYATEYIWSQWHGVLADYDFDVAGVLGL